MPQVVEIYKTIMTDNLKQYNYNPFKPHNYANLCHLYYVKEDKDYILHINGVLSTKYSNLITLDNKDANKDLICLSDSQIRKFNAFHKTIYNLDALAINVDNDEEINKIYITAIYHLYINYKQINECLKTFQLQPIDLKDANNNNIVVLYEKIIEI